MSNYFITGIGTGVGKTFAAAILTEALKADYWKPVQCGMEGGTDKEKVTELVSNSNSVFHAETYCFKEAVAPNLAALNEQTKIVIEKFVLPKTENHLIIEGAGGILVPIGEHSFVIDIAREINAEVILVINNYLGCINHSLLSIDYLIKNEFELKGLIFNGKFDTEVKKAIMNYAELPIIAEFPEIETVNKDSVLNLVQKVDLSLF